MKKCLQALLDVYTIKREIGRLDNFSIGLVGDLANGRTVRSLAYLLSMYPGVKMYFVAPEVVRMKQDIKEFLTRCPLAASSFDACPLPRLVPLPVPVSPRYVMLRWLTRVVAQQLADGAVPAEACRVVWSLHKVRAPPLRQVQCLQVSASQCAQEGRRMGGGQRPGGGGGRRGRAVPGELCSR